MIINGTTIVKITISGLRDHTWTEHIVTHGRKTDVSVTVREPYEDTITLEPEEYMHLVQLLRDEISTREKKLGHDTRMWSFNDPEYRRKHEGLIDLLVRMDI